MKGNATSTRRSVLQATGTALALGGLAATGTPVAAQTWTEANTPTTETLYDVVYAVDGAYAVGGNGYFIERAGAGEWTTVTEDGPSGNGNDLYGATVTDDGERVWFVGASGAVGEYDTASGDTTPYDPLSETEGSTTDQSAPDDDTGNFRDVVATGDGGEANVYITDESGQIHYSFDNGDSWQLVTPGSGSTIPAIDFYEETAGHVSDTNQTVAATTDGETYDKIGIGNRDENFYGIDSNDADNVWVCADDGMVFEYDGSWSAETLGQFVLRDIEVATDRSAGLTVGAGGRVFRRTPEWTEEATPTDEHLHGVVRGTPDFSDPEFVVSEAPDIAVGRNGTAIED